jgi:hypothetical protein
VEEQNCLGIYLGKGAATVVCIGSKGKQRSIQGSFSVFAEPEEEGKQQSLGKLIAQGCAERQLKYSEVVVALDCAMFMQHSIHSEFADSKQMAATVRFDTEESLATDITEVAIAFKVDSSGQDGSLLTVFTAQKKILTDILNDLQRNNIDPLSIEPDVGCLARFICENNLSGEQRSLYGLFSEHNGYFIIPAGDKAEQSIVRTFMTGHRPDRGELLTREVPMMTAALEGDKAVNCLKVFDAMDSLDLEKLSAKLNMPVSGINLIEAAQAEATVLDNCAGPVDFAIAYGAAMGHLAKVPSVNFRNDFMPYMGKKIKMQKTLKIVCMAITFVLLVLGVYLQYELSQRNKPLKQLRSQFAKEYSAVMPGKKLDLQENPVKKLESELRRIKNVKSGKLGVTGEQSISSKLILVFEAFNECSKETGLNIDKITVASRSINIIGDTSSRDSTLKLFESLKKRLEISQYRYDLKNERDSFSVTVATKGS